MDLNDNDELIAALRRREQRQQEAFAGPVGVGIALLIGAIMAAVMGAYQ